MQKKIDSTKNKCDNGIMDKGIPYIDEIIPIIVAHASPDQIILFGSYARGDSTEKSDIDLLIVKKGLKKGRDIIASIYMAFYEQKMKNPALKGQGSSFSRGIAFGV